MNIEALARKAGLKRETRPLATPLLVGYYGTPDELERFAGLVRAAAISDERERINALLSAIREHWVKANGEDAISVGALDQIAEVIADGSFVQKEDAAAIRALAAPSVASSDTCKHGNQHPCSLCSAEDAEHDAAMAAQKG